MASEKQYRGGLKNLKGPLQVETEDGSDEARKICVDCSVGFVISDAEAHYFRIRGFDLPKRCPDCRKISSARWKQRRADASERLKQDARTTIGDILRKHLGGTTT